MTLTAPQSHLGVELGFGSPLRESQTYWHNDDPGEIRSPFSEATVPLILLPPALLPTPTPGGQRISLPLTGPSVLRRPPMHTCTHARAQAHARTIPITRVCPPHGAGSHYADLRNQESACVTTGSAAVAATVVTGKSQRGMKQQPSRRGSWQPGREEGESSGSGRCRDRPPHRHLLACGWPGPQDLICFLNACTAFSAGQRNSPPSRKSYSSGTCQGTKC